MLIDLSDLLMHEGKSASLKADIEMNSFSVLGLEFKIIEKQQLTLQFKNIEKNLLTLETVIKLSLSIPCDRCVEEVVKKFELNVNKEIDIKLLGTDELEFMEKNFLDVDKFVCSEIFPELPMKVVCKEDCKGICPKCGCNLNIEECNCDRTELDPRMSRFLDVFNEFKEV